MQCASGSADVQVALHVREPSDRSLASGRMGLTSFVHSTLEQRARMNQGASPQAQCSHHRCKGCVCCTQCTLDATSGATNNLLPSVLVAVAGPPWPCSLWSRVASSPSRQHTPGGRGEGGTKRRPCGTLYGTVQGVVLVSFAAFGCLSCVSWSWACCSCRCARRVTVGGAGVLGSVRYNSWPCHRFCFQLGPLWAAHQNN